MAADAHPAALRVDARAVVQTPPGRGGVAVIVLSGPSSATILEDTFRPFTPGASLPPVGGVLLGDLIDPRQHDQTRLDEALVAACPPDPAGRCVFEINVHGGRQVVRSVLRLLASRGVEIASHRDSSAASAAWSVTHPAWGNPAVGGDMLECLAHGECRLAIELLSRQWSGGLSELAACLLDRLDGDAGAMTDPERDVAIEKLRRAAARFDLARRVLRPPTVVFAGPPNAGKTSLVNAVSGHPVGIVSDAPGTTRDWLSRQVEIAGVAVELIDTAGLWDGPIDLDVESVAASWSRIESADLVLAVVDAAVPPPSDEPHYKRLLGLEGVTIVANKCDLVRGGIQADIRVSAATGESLADLGRMILDRLGLRDIDCAAATAFHVRQLKPLTRAADALERGDPAGAAAHVRDLLGRDGPQKP